MTLEELTLTLKSTKGNAFSTAQIINDIDRQLIYQLPEAEMRKIANILVSSSNKRIRRLLRAAPKGISEAALRGAGVLQKRYGEINDDEVDVRFFSIKDKNRNQISREIRRMINFQEMKTSTVTGAIERRRENECLVFGETREERAKREKAEAKAKARGEEIERNESVRNAMITPETIETMGMKPDDIMSVVFSHYRRYEETHSKIIKDMGSDFIIRMMGLFADAHDEIRTREDLDKALDEVDKTIESAWEQIDSEEDADFFDQMEAYANGKSDKPPHFTVEDGWR